MTDLTAARKIAEKIGEYYLAKNDSDYTATKNDLQNLQITNLVANEVQVEIHLGRPGLLIGRKGENIKALAEYLGIEVKIIEAECWMFWLMPYCPADHEEY